MESTHIAAIETSRLNLLSMPTACLQALAVGDYLQAHIAGGFVVDPDCSLLNDEWVGRRLRMIEADPEQHAWMYRAIIRKSDRVMVGHISFHHKAPDPFLLEYSRCGAELGYTIEAPYRRQGYATESALAMMDWARQRNVEDFFLTISPQNIPSIKLAESMQYRKIGELMDETDGIEYLYTTR
jgi:[ribosomal protein S5]-alanine N-acetyltransferase